MHCSRTEPEEIVVYFVGGGLTLVPVEVAGASDWLISNSLF